MLEDYPNGITQIYGGNYICKNCGYVGAPETIYKGDPRIPVYSFFLLPVLWIIVYFAISPCWFFRVFFVSMIYMAYMIWGRQKSVCPKCGSENVMPYENFKKGMDIPMIINTIRMIRDNYAKKHLKGGINDKKT